MDIECRQRGIGCGNMRQDVVRKNRIIKTACGFKLRIIRCLPINRTVNATSSELSTVAKPTTRERPCRWALVLNGCVLCTRLCQRIASSDQACRAVEIHRMPPWRTRSRCTAEVSAGTTATRRLPGSQDRPSSGHTDFCESAD